MKPSLPTRLLHFLVVAATIRQLVISLFMQMPSSSGRSGSLAFAFHQIVGLVSLDILLFFWVWTTVMSATGAAALDPILANLM
jgi:cytochrome b561